MESQVFLPITIGHPRVFILNHFRSWVILQGNRLPNAILSSSDTAKINLMRIYVYLFYLYMCNSDRCVLLTTIVLFFMFGGIWLLWYPLTWWILILVLIPAGGSTTYYIRRRYDNGPKEQVTLEEVEPILKNTLYF